MTIETVNLNAPFSRLTLVKIARPESQNLIQERLWRQGSLLLQSTIKEYEVYVRYDLEECTPICVCQCLMHSISIPA